MKQLTRILFYFVLMILLTAEDCSNIGEKRSVDIFEANLYAEIEKEITSAELSDEALIAFEKRAEQKLIDLIDYLNICADSSVSFEFRAQAKKMIEEAFISNADVQVLYNNLGLIEDKTDTILREYGRNSLNSKLVSKEVNQSFQKVSASEYEGEIELVLLVDDNLIAQHLIMSVVKTPKTFGGETLSLWKIFFSVKE